MKLNFLKRQTSPKGNFNSIKRLFSALPPFGNLFSLKMIVDEKFLTNDTMAFNAGSLGDSVVMKVEDWKSMVEFETLNCSK
jgi:prolyl-tRNA editing enzyme YbaK/EbsC (Cys-tRNA(Pro) deacylase)